ncbi:hypothetical protein HDU97_001449 [Phlyctochytrium planicorne]|nr:hypothetical protein HDU97_001449 [Phlyctochytrium planicorne]
MQILRFVDIDDKILLLSAMRVCRIWLHAARSLFWTSITVTNSQEAWQRCIHSIGFISSSSSSSSVLSFLPAADAVKRFYRPIPKPTVKYGEYIRSLDLMGIILLQGWNPIIECCPKLEDMSVYKCKFGQASYSSFKFAHPRQLLGLKTLSVAMTKLVSAQSLLPLLRSAPNIISLSLAGTNLDERELCDCIQYLKNLKSFSLGSEEAAHTPGASMAPGEGTYSGVRLALELAAYCKDLTGLDLVGTVSLSPLAFSGLISVDLTQETSDIDGEAVPAPSYRTLRRISLREASSHLSDGLHRTILTTPAAVSNLQSLTLNHAHTLSTSSLVDIVHAVAPTLEFLELSGLNIGDDAIIAVAENCEKLKQWRLIGLPFVQDFGGLVGGRPRGREQYLQDQAEAQQRNLQPKQCLSNLEVLSLHALPKLGEAKTAVMVEAFGQVDENEERIVLLGCRKIKHLHLIQCPMLGEDVAMKLLENWPIQRFIYKGEMSEKQRTVGVRKYDS